LDLVVSVAPEDLQGNLVKLEDLDLGDHLGLEDLLVLLVYLVKQELLDPLDLLDHQASLDKLDLLDLQGS